MDYILEFEKPVTELENQIKELKIASERPNIDLSKEIGALQRKVDLLMRDIYNNLSEWERVQLARHPLRPHTIDFVDGMFSDFKELHGDRRFKDDPSVIAGFGFLDQNTKAAFVGIEKGRKTQDKIRRNFGMAHPEGYRKALRVMKMAAQFNVPIITFVDTPGAYPGVGAEERGQAQAIAENLEEMFSLGTPIISIVIGEGGSGGALGISIADKILMMEHSIYSVISPESCASILWSDPKMAEKAANSLQLSAKKAKVLGVADGIIAEPPGGAHRDPQVAVQMVKDHVLKELQKFQNSQSKRLLKKRFEKFRQMGNEFLQDKV
jgi:acetyl-CoA carboxylase carboxyl transferase subunit alpha